MYMYVCSVLWVRMAVILHIHFTNCRFCKIIVLKDVLLKYLMYELLSISCSTARLSLQVISLNQTYWYTWHPLVSGAFNKIKLVSCHLLLYVINVNFQLQRPSREAVTVKPRSTFTCTRTLVDDVTVLALTSGDVVVQLVVRCQSHQNVETSRDRGDGRRCGRARWQ